MANKPYCTCDTARNEGWTQDPKTGDWVHPRCGKPSKMYFEKHVMPEMIAAMLRERDRHPRNAG